jgi:hypothetical protein
LLIIARRPFTKERGKRRRRWRTGAAEEGETGRVSLDWHARFDGMLTRYRHSSTVSSTIDAAGHVPACRYAPGER